MRAPCRIGPSPEVCHAPVLRRSPFIAARHSDGRSTAGRLLWAPEGLRRALPSWNRTIWKSLMCRSSIRWSSRAWTSSSMRSAAGWRTTRSPPPTATLVSARRWPTTTKRCSTWYSTTWQHGGHRSRQIAQPTSSASSSRHAWTPRPQKSAGVDPIRPLLAQIDSIDSRAKLLKSIAHLQMLGVDVLFGFGPGADPHDAAHYMAWFPKRDLACPIATTMSPKVPAPIRPAPSMPIMWHNC